MEDIVQRLVKRADIRMQATSRRSVQEGQPDRLAALLVEAAGEITRLRKQNSDLGWMVSPDRMGQ